MELRFWLGFLAGLLATVALFLVIYWYERGLL